MDTADTASGHHRTGREEIRVSKYDAEIQFWRDLHDKAPALDDRYLRHLLVPADYFEGMKVLEVGPGPLSWARIFTGCELWGIDPLTDRYRALGYELAPMRYVQGFAEDMPFEDNEFDAVISFNALDHVDDFDKVCSEIERVCKGVIRVEVHYHEAWVCEPMELDDNRVGNAFSAKVKKLIERPFGETFFPGHPASSSYDGTVALWSTDPHIEKGLL